MYVYLYWKQNMSDKIQLVCDFCGKHFEMIKWHYQKRINARKHKEYTKVVCDSKECRSKQKSDVGKWVMEINKKEGNFDARRAFRKGRTVEEAFGEDIGKRIRQSAKDNYVNHRKGKLHSSEAKVKMSNSRKLFIEINPEAGRIHSEFIKNMYKNEPERRTEMSRKTSDRVMQGWYIKKHSHSGIYHYWYGGEVVFDSSYELAYFMQLNERGVIWRRNNIIKIPYIYKGVKKYTIPDILIGEWNEIGEIHEVKPYEFAYNEPKTEYHKITQAKLEAIKQYCIEHNYMFKIVTEQQIEKRFITLVNENAKSKGKEGVAYDFTRRKGSILS